MDVLVPSYINALNGTTATIPCTFTSCYKIDLTKFGMNWTYQETHNDTEEKVTYGSCFYTLQYIKFSTSKTKSVLNTFSFFTVYALPSEKNAGTAFEPIWRQGCVFWKPKQERLVNHPIRCSARGRGDI